MVYYKINMKFLKLLIVFCVIFSSPFSLAKTIDEQFSDVENLMEIDQNKEALKLLKTIDPKTDTPTQLKKYAES